MQVYSLMTLYRLPNYFKMKHCIVFLFLRLLIVPLLLLGFVSDAQFKLFNSIHYAGIPHSYNYANNYGNYYPYLQGFILDYGAAVGGSSGKASAPNTTNIQQYATEALKNPSWPVSFDVEINWPTSGQALTDSVNNYISAVNIFKTVNPQSPVSFYGLPPYPNAWKWSGVNGNTTFENVSKSTQYVSLANAVDYFSPSLYAYSTDDTITWRKYADTMVNTIRKYYSNTKPIYPYIWPQWHDGTNALIDTATWYYQLDYLYKHTQGAIIWSGTGYTWDGNAAWWQTTKKFMARKGLVPPVVVDSFYVSGISTTGNNNVRWLTSVDTTTKYFQLEKSLDNINYTVISGLIARSGGNYTMNAYNFIDTGISSSTVYYRLKALSATNVATYIDTLQNGYYQSRGTGVTVDLASAADWLVNNNGVWSDATLAPAGLVSGRVVIRANDTWQNNISTVPIASGVSIVDSAASGVFSTTNLIQNNGTIIFCGNSLQTIPGAASLTGSTWGNIVVNNTNGVSSTQSTASSFLHIGALSLAAGTLTITASGGKSVSLYMDSSVNVGTGHLTVTNAATNYGVIINGKAAQLFPNGTFLNNTVYALTVSNSNGFTYSGPLTISNNLKISLASIMSTVGTIAMGSLTVDTLTTALPLQTTGGATVAGALTINKFRNIPYIGQKIIIIKTSNGVSGTFASVVLPAGYSGTVATEGNNVVLTIAGIPNGYRSLGTGVFVSLGSASNWQSYNSPTWVTATSAPSTLSSGRL